jgi:hypothetical protein
VFGEHPFDFVKKIVNQCRCILERIGPPRISFDAVPVIGYRRTRLAASLGQWNRMGVIKSHQPRVVRPVQRK